MTQGAGSATVGTCRSCGNALVTAGQQPPWCPACLAGLDTWVPASERPARVGWQPTEGQRRRDDRWHRKRFVHGFAGDAAEFARLAGVDQQRPKRSGLIVGLGLLSAILVLLPVGCVLAALLLWTRGGAGPIVTGLFLVLLGAVLLPRVPRRPATPVQMLERVSHPRLWALIDRVAASVGTAPPDDVGVSSEFGAWCGRFGLRRRSLLVVGLPLQVALPPQALVALIGHELGHLVNGDADRSLLLQPALHTFGRLSEVLDPRGSTRFRARVGHSGQLFAWLGQWLAFAVLWPVSKMFRGLDFVVQLAHFRQSRAAEYYADELARRAAGSAALVTLMETLLLSRSVYPAVREAASVTADPTVWRRVADRAVAARRSALPVLAQLSMRTGADVLASHPPTGRRIAMTTALPDRSGAVELGPTELAGIDSELADQYRRTRIDIKI